MKGKRGPDCNIPLGLAIFETEEWQAKRKRWKRRLRLSSIPTYDELADLCGCRRTAVQLIALKALHKMRIRMIEQWPEHEIREMLQALTQASDHKTYEH